MDPSVDYEQGTWLYSNFFLLAAVIIGATLILARLISPWVWKKVRRIDAYSQALGKTELFISRGKSVIDPSPCGLLRAFLTVVPGAPFQLLLVPAFMALIAPRELLLVLTFATLIASYLVLFLAGMDPTHEFMEMFTLMASSAFPGGKADLSPVHISERILDFKYLTALILVGLSFGTGLLIKFSPQLAQLESGSQATPEVRPGQLLDDHAGRRQCRPALIVAASGGGTRAALYTASVLEGLAHKDRIEDVLIGSGVSGGGAALAYFAGRRKMLLDEPGIGWEEYFNVMRQPFIRDVINSAMQWRTVFGARLGVLLAESFKNRWKLDDTCEMGQVKKFGLILNTAIAGRFDCIDYSLATTPRRLRKANTFTEADNKALDAFADTVRQMKKDGVRLEVCDYALQVLGVDPGSIMPEVDHVGNGFISVIGFQAQGYSHVTVD